MSVNVSPRQLHDPNFVAVVSEALMRSHVPAEQLWLEITEGVMIVQPDQALATLTKLCDIGVRIAIDDFGTGYSSLGYLRKMPIDKIKIDRSFITDMASSDSDMMIVKTMITLAHGLGKRILAEGVEDENQLGLLRHMACDAVQGYLIAKPLPEAQALALLQPK